jgi:phosphate transport system protein
MEHLNMELEGLKRTLLTMASHAETAVNEAVRSLVDRNYDLAIHVKNNDDTIDRLELEVDEMAIHLLAKAPLAGDLRFVMVAMKISNNLERVGDEATKIAKRARDLSGEPPVKVTVDLPRMAGLALAMLKAALDAFVNRDPATARLIIPKDKEVDALNRQINNDLADHMVANPDTVKRCLHLITASKSLERIADHAKNMAEEVVYLCEAQDIRHMGKGAA